MCLKLLTFCKINFSWESLLYPVLCFIWADVLLDMFSHSYKHIIYAVLRSFFVHQDTVMVFLYLFYYDYKKSLENIFRLLHFCGFVYHVFHFTAIWIFVTYTCYIPSHLTIVNIETRCIYTCRLHDVFVP